MQFGKPYSTAPEPHSLRLQQVEGLFRLRGGMDLVPLALQQVGQQIELKRILVNGEDRSHLLPPR